MRGLRGEHVVQGVVDRAEQAEDGLPAQVRAGQLPPHRVGEVACHSEGVQLTSNTCTGPAAGPELSCKRCAGIGMLTLLEGGPYVSICRPSPAPLSLVKATQMQGLVLGLRISVGVLLRINCWRGCQEACTVSGLTDQDGEPEERIPGGSVLEALLPRQHAGQQQN